MEEIYQGLDINEKLKFYDYLSLKILYSFREIDKILSSRELGLHFGMIVFKKYETKRFLILNESLSKNAFFIIGQLFFSIFNDPLKVKKIFKY